MFITRVKLKNWRNFRIADVPLRERTIVLGANAAGKSNFLEVFRFLRDVCKPQGGGLQKAIADHGGISKIRCLHARRDTSIRIEIHFSESVDDVEPIWRYILEFNREGKGTQRILISSEEVWRGGKRLFERPSADDQKDDIQLTETYLEQTRANKDFRELTTFLGEATYLHLVPQLLKFADALGGHRLTDDPFGQGFLEKVAKTPAKTRDARLRRIAQALRAAVPQFEELIYDQDKVSGSPHLAARYAHHRPNAGWQREDQFSDGTLRLLGLLWSLIDGDSLLLLEEPELSLNDAVVRQIPLLLQRVQRGSKRRRQIIISTHSDALLSDKGIDGRDILLIEPGPEGSTMRSIDAQEEAVLRSGFSVAEVVLPKTRPNLIAQMELWE